MSSLKRRCLDAKSTPLWAGRPGRAWAILVGLDTAAPSPADSTNEHLARLQWITSALSRSLTPAEVANVVMGHAFDALQASTGVAYFVAGDDPAPRYAGSRGVAARDVAAWKGGTAGAVLGRGGGSCGPALWLRNRFDILEHLPCLDQWATSTDLLQAIVALPLQIEGRLLGAIAFSFSSEQRFGDRQRDFLLTLAEVSAQALDRARLFEAERRAREEAAETNRRL